jgi:hypothetical protein
MYLLKVGQAHARSHVAVAYGGVCEPWVWPVSLEALAYTTGSPLPLSSLLVMAMP